MKSLLAGFDIETLAHEESVRGTLVRMVMKQAENAEGAELALLEKSLQLLLGRFQSMEGDAL